jgi:coiled-coil and C2 domain-containing protein 2A
MDSKKIICEKMLLKIFVSHLTFDHHPLFTNEHIISKSLENLYEQHIQRISENITHRLRTKLKILRQNKSVAPNDVDEKSSRNLKNEEITLHNQIKTVRGKLHKEEKYDRELLKKILETWKNLKDIRKQQGYAFTKCSLKIQKINVDLEVDKDEWQKRYDMELNEMIDEEFGHYQIHKQKYKDYLRKLREAEDSNIETIHVVKKPKKPDVDKIIQTLNELYEKTLKPLGEPEVIVNLIESEDTTTDVRIKWKKLYKKIQSNSYLIKLSIDNEIIGSTKHCLLNQGFKVEIDSAFLIKLTKKVPEIIKLIVSFPQISNKFSIFY